MQKESWIFAGVAALAIVALALVAMPRGGAIKAPSHLTATGSASVQVTPDQASVSLGITTRAATVQAAEGRNDAAMTKVQAAVRKLGVSPKDMQTQNYNVSQTYDNHGKPNGYEVDDDLSVTVPTAHLAGEVISAGTQAGANQVMGISWSVTNPSHFSGKAYALALKRAKKTARTLAAGLGLRLSGVASVQVVTTPALPIFRGYQDAMAMKSAAPLTPGTQPVTATLKVIFDVR